MDSVLAAVAAELRVIVKKDIHRRIIEGVAFVMFDQWWDERERTAKVTSHHALYKTVCSFDLHHFHVSFIEVTE